MAHIRQSGPYSGLGFQAKALAILMLAADEAQNLLRAKNVSWPREGAQIVISDLLDPYHKSPDSGERQHK